jgi:hypothetical protein
MELISVALRNNFREFCSNIVLRQIDDLFLGCGIQRKEVSSEILSQTSGARRTRVEEYYASLDWTKPADVQKFLDVISFALVQEYVPRESHDPFSHSISSNSNRTLFQLRLDRVSI